MLNKFYFALLLCFVAHVAHAQSLSPQVPLAANDNATEVAESLQFCDNVVHVVELMIANRLPLAAQAEAADLLNETKKGVAFCKEEFDRNRSQYHTCCSGTLRLSTEAISIMAGNYWSNAASGAARLSFFW